MVKRLSVSSLLMALTLVGCGNANVEIFFDTLTSGNIRFSYEILPEFLFLNNRNNPLRWPVDQAGWTALVSRIQGLSLTSFTSRDALEGLSVTVQLRFTNLQALESLALELGQKLTVIGVQNVYTWTLEYQIPAIPTAQLRTLAGLSLEGKQVSWTITAPRTVREAGRAQITAAGRGFSLTDNLVDILSARTPALRVVW